MKHSILLGILLVLVLLVSACGPAVTATPGQVTEPPVQATEPAATSSPEATEPPAATASPEGTATSEATASPEAAIPVTGQAEVRAAANFDYGPILVDGDGLSLYIFSGDTQNGDASACTDETCMASWTPLTTEGNAVAGPGVIQNMLGMITREDGTTQVTYNGWPLYHYAGDAAPEDVNGHGAEPGWTLVSPSGNAIPAE